ncbi:nicotinate-nucleotide--dimethylbenzimidazole phosphoribosyltransferase [Streptomyces sp. NPDC005820]|uniref:nicotinate-nucleotide--dimethylbenzimidazole phosphoribosyltransferase n=1 Tax=Streptomyces sp. NPDC005820 TaxID=3157069 RepID=UPI00341112D1
MTDTGQVPGEGLPENAGTVEQPGASAHGAYTYLSETTAEDEDLLLLPGAQSAWGNEVAPPAPEPVVETVHEPGPHEISGRDSGSVDLSAVRLPSPAAPPQQAPRRPLHLGPPIPDASASPVRSLADRGPAGAPVRHPVQPASGPEYLDVAPLREMPPQGAAPWGTAAQGPVATGVTTAETVAPVPVTVPATEPSAPEPGPLGVADAVVARVATEAVAATAPPEAQGAAAAYGGSGGEAGGGEGGGDVRPTTPAARVPGAVTVDPVWTPAPAPVEPGLFSPTLSGVVDPGQLLGAALIAEGEQDVADEVAEEVEETVQVTAAEQPAGFAEPFAAPPVEAVPVPAAPAAPEALEVPAAPEAPQAADSGEAEGAVAAAVAGAVPAEGVQAETVQVVETAAVETAAVEEAQAPGVNAAEAAPAAEVAQSAEVAQVAEAAVSEVAQAPEDGVSETAETAEVADVPAPDAVDASVAPEPEAAQAAEASPAEAAQPSEASAPVSEPPVPDETPVKEVAQTVTPAPETEAQAPEPVALVEAPAPAEPAQETVAAEQETPAVAVDALVPTQAAEPPVPAALPETTPSAEAATGPDTAQPAEAAATPEAPSAPEAAQPAEAPAVSDAPLLTEPTAAPVEADAVAPAAPAEVEAAQPVQPIQPAEAAVAPPAEPDAVQPQPEPVAENHPTPEQAEAAAPTADAQPEPEPQPEVNPEEPAAVTEPLAPAAHQPDTASQAPDAPAPTPAPTPAAPPQQETPTEAEAEAVAAAPEEVPAAPRAIPAPSPQPDQPVGTFVPVEGNVATTPHVAPVPAQAVALPTDDRQPADARPEAPVEVTEAAEAAPAEQPPVTVAPAQPAAPTVPAPRAADPAPVPATPDPEPEADVQADPDPEVAQSPEDLETRAADQEESPATVEEARESTGPAAPAYDDAEREAVLKVMRERRDIRNGFRGDPIPHEVLLRVLEAAHTAPSVGHSQPWDFVVIRSAETRRAMHELAMRQRDAYAKSLPKGRAKQFKELKIEAILETPVNIVVTADPTRGGRHTLGRHTQPQMAPYSSALAVENLWLAARAEGLGVGWVSFFDEREMVRALGLPDHLEVVAYLCVGYVDEFPPEPELMQAGWAKRRPLSWVVHEETYGRRALPGEDPHDLLAETVASVRPLDAKALGEAWERQKRMTKPAGALGMLEIISAQLSGLSRQCPPPIPEPAAVAIFAGDHGVHAQGVTPWPQEVTAQMVANFLGGGAVCNAFASQVGAEVCVVDVGVAADLPATPGLLPRKVRAGTSDMTAGPAMTREEAQQAIEVGIETARDLVAAGNKALLTGEMGIANTTASAALISVFTGADPSEVTGRGTGINDETLARKTEVVRRALELHQPDPADPIGVLAAIGGFEHAAMVGLLLGGASLRTPVILDGVSAGAAALVARAIAPEVLAACIAGHRSAEPGHVAALNKLGLRPLVDLDLRLGEGTGALLALPLVQSTARAMHEVATFDSAGVTEK